MRKSFSTQPLTRLSPQRPLLIWSSVAPMRATTPGWKNAVWTVEIILSRSVTMARAAAVVNESSEVLQNRDGPKPAPPRWAMKKISSPARSSISATRRLYSKVASVRCSALETSMKDGSPVGGRHPIVGANTPSSRWRSGMYSAPTLLTPDATSVHIRLGQEIGRFAVGAEFCIRPSVAAPPLGRSQGSPLHQCTNVMCFDLDS